MSKELKYTEAFDELQQIVSDLEDGEISVDELSLKIKRASELIKVCKQKLVATEEDVNQILKELEG
ncbi:exodeoxyribonuclease VII small subunit [Crocinitomicaceae bacterium CZZ-1]|uniref:Exodeoxyribonuclease VII small subunit n=1 Tax=Taishania pollutisoli TaxID=2766479 RepID=A0A8J6PCP2_9FLAO|nr:exodeoxyribonuclease VII small subunit [Taishania pollutisoli]MBC9812522.1 exodeoxyribonuclease VII small subunit [Taishania pollutisoli]MBX2949419.1 exodeoxyribonuclease VII small subunit [Crocinitomicaceae bacterium]NGF74498.1 exodeoxyribonuclease VII small subunit [Fluviicola sp. SGL-29]